MLVVVIPLSMSIIGVACFEMFIRPLLEQTLTEPVEEKKLQPGVVVEAEVIQVINPGWLKHCEDCSLVEKGDACRLEVDGTVKVYNTDLPYSQQIGIYTDAKTYIKGRSCPNGTMFWNPKSRYLDGIHWEG